jgi:uncharacterized protein (TIGR01777 family)
MRIVLPGGTGQVGGILRRAFTAVGHDVTTLSRSGPEGWDGRTLGPWASVLDGADAVINLAGRSVSCRYTQANLEEMLRSRVDSARVIGEAIATVAKPPSVWLQASTATIYADRRDTAHDEATGIIGGHEPDVPGYWAFSVRIAREWEAACLAADLAGTRRVLMRSAMVMSPDRGGVFDYLLRMARLGLGGPVAGGGQYVSWIHDVDCVRAVSFLLESDLEGPVNVCSPHPLPQRDLMRAMRRAWGRRPGLPATAWMAELGAWALRSDTELLLKSRRVVPGRLLDAGFSFEHPEWPEAAQDLVRRVRAR